MAKAVTISDEARAAQFAREMGGVAIDTAEYAPAHLTLGIIHEFRSCGYDGWGVLHRVLAPNESFTASRVCGMVAWMRGLDPPVRFRRSPPDVARAYTRRYRTLELIRTRYDVETLAWVLERERRDLALETSIGAL
jgi:hypothetical protein